MNKGHGIGITKKKNSVAVEGTQLSPLVIKQTTRLDSNELKHQQGRNQRWKRSIRPMELFAGPHHLTGQLPCYLQQALTNCTLSSILHNIVLEAAHLSAVGHGMVLLPSLIGYTAEIAFFIVRGLFLVTSVMPLVQHLHSAVAGSKTAASLLVHHTGVPRELWCQELVYVTVRDSDPSVSQLHNTSFGPYFI